MQKRGKERKFFIVVILVLISMIFASYINTIPTGNLFRIIRTTPLSISQQGPSDEAKNKCYGDGVCEGFLLNAGSGTAPFIGDRSGEQKAKTAAIKDCENSVNFGKERQNKCLKEAKNKCPQDKCIYKENKDDRTVPCIVESCDLYIYGVKCTFYYLNGNTIFIGCEPSGRSSKTPPEWDCFASDGILGDATFSCKEKPKTVGTK